MTPKHPQKILSRVSNGTLAGHTETAERIYLSALAGSGSSFVRIAGAPGAGTSELLRYTYDRLFLEQRFVVPFYFALRAEDGSAHEAAARFVYEFLLQSVAFRRNDPALIAASPELRELQKLAPLADAGWVKELSDAPDSNSPLNYGNSSLRSALAAPIRAAAKGRFRVCSIIDDLHHSVALEKGRSFLDQFQRVTPNAGSTIILAARRRFELSGSPHRTIEIEVPDRASAAAIAEQIAGDEQVELTDPVRDLIAVRSEGRPGSIRSIIAAARDRNIDLDSYRNAARVYASMLSTIGFDGLSDRDLVAALHSATEAPFSLATLRERLAIDNDRFQRLVEQLSVTEVIDVAGSSARLSGSPMLRDYLEHRRATDVQGMSADAATASAALRFLQRSPDTMARDYRREAAAGLRELLTSFDLQEVPTAAIDYRAFRDSYKGLSDVEIRAQIAGDTNTFQLPQIVHASELTSFAPSAVFESERAVAGVGFIDRAYRSEDEIVWIAAELDSKLEADPELVGEWFGRLEAAISEAGFANVRFWLVALDGFSPGALEMIAERGGIGSSRRQLTFLREAIYGVAKEGADAQVFEMVIPVGEETELIAAHSLEEIARRHDFPAKAINQVKTALVEACINAAEHGLSPDRKIYLKYAFHSDRLTVTVSNRGIRLADKMATPVESVEPAADSRRGWGLGLMRSLMDDVRLEPVDDGTRIVMTKLLPEREL